MKEIARRMLDTVLPLAPPAVQRWIERARTARGLRFRRRENVDAARRGHRLISESGLEAKYIDAIRLLRSRAHEMGDYLEFGVYAGASLACMHRALVAENENRVRFFGFDSFEGLPASTAEESLGVWKPSEFAMDERFTRDFLLSQGVDDRRVTLVRGWFSDTLTPALAERYAIRKASLILVDCDIYSSARDALAFCAPLIRDMAVVFFDDWHTGGLAEADLGEKKAFHEFLAANPHLDVEPLGGYDKFSEVFALTRRADKET